jgi:uncharacterized protein (TIGR00266 family)
MLKYEILGDDMQALVLSLDAGQKVRAEAGSMMYMTDNIQMETTLGGAEGKGVLGGLMSGIKRAVAGESFFITTFEAEGGPAKVAFAPPYPGKVVPLNLAETGDMLCQRDAFLCSELDVDVSIAFTKRIGAGFFGGEGFILQKLSGSGMAYIHSGGYILSVDLAAGEALKVDTGCLVAMTKDVDYDIQMAKGIKTMLFGGEGLFFAHLQGPGRVYLQTLPFSRMADRIISAARGGNAEESKGLAGVGGGLLGGLISGND